MITDIKIRLYQLIDTSEYINDLSKMLCKDYEYYTNLLTLACIEEKYLMLQLELDLTNYLGIKHNKNIFRRNKIHIKTTDYNHIYIFKLPKLDKYSQKYIELECLFKTIHRDTLDFWGTTSLFSRKSTEFTLKCRHPDFDTDKYLKSKNVKIKMEYK